MREIKFRAWDKNLKKMIYEDDYQYTKLNENTSNLFKNYDKSKIMQYTGIKDKNNVEIYEFDIIENETGRKGKVIFNKFIGAFDCVAINSKGDPSDFEFRNWKYVKIVGNIHEEKND